MASPALSLEWQKDDASLDLNGYYKNLLTVTDTHDFYRDLGLVDRRVFIDDYNRLRIKTKLAYADILALHCHYEAFISSGDTMLARYRLEQEMRQLEQFGFAVPEDDITMSLMSLSATPRFFDMEEAMPRRGGRRTAHNIDRLYLELHSRYVSGDIGRMALSWGSGRIWNPTDMWSPFSPTEIDKDEKRGVDLVHVTFSIPKVGSLEGVYAPLDLEKHYSIRAEDSSAGGRFLFSLGEYDIALMGGMFGPDTVAGFDFSGYLWNAGFRGEATYTFVDPDDLERDYVRAVLSVDYGWAAWGNPYLLVEAYFNGLGEPDPDKYLERLQDASVQRQITMGRAFNLGRDYVTALTTLMPHPLVTLGLQPIANVDDGSLFVYLYTQYSVTDYADLIGGINLLAGPDNSEFGGIPIEELDIDYRPSDMYFLYLKAYF